MHETIVGNLNQLTCKMINCIGVERRLIDCPRGYEYAQLKYDWECPNKVQVHCNNNCMFN